MGRYLSRQAALPQGGFGRLLAWRWISETAAVNDLTLEILKPAPGERICEIGFGPGRTLALVAAAGAEVIGLDVSPDMVKIAGRRNADAIVTGRVELLRGDGVTIPVPDDHLDAALAVYNFYFWPDPAATLADLARTLRPGGRLVLVSLPDDYPLSSRRPLDLPGARRGRGDCLARGGGLHPRGRGAEVRHRCGCLAHGNRALTTAYAGRASRRSLSR